MRRIPDHVENQKAVSDQHLSEALGNLQEVTMTQVEELKARYAVFKTGLRVRLGVNEPILIPMLFLLAIM